MIKFLCPNGHQLTAPDHLAGKSGKCPKCSTAFMVPTLEELAETAESPSADGAALDADRMPPTKTPLDAPGEQPGAESNATDAKSDIGKSGVVSGSKIGTESTKSSVKPGVFVFLCPNGHKLNGPPSLKGKAGQCPHCGARFVIPEDDVPEEDIPTGAVDEDDEVPAGEPVEDDVPIDPEMAEEDVVEAEVEELEPDPEPIPPGVHALGYIVGRLWDHKSDTTELEIFLQEGEIISPDHYAEILSTGEYGVFAHRESEDNYSLSVIPWSAVRRVDLRQVRKLAHGTFR